MLYRYLPIAKTHLFPPSITHPTMYANPFDAFTVSEPTPARKTALVYDRACERHEAPEAHPECPDRVKVPLKHLRHCDLLDRFVWLGRVEPCSRERLKYAHTEEYVDSMLDRLLEEQQKSRESPADEPSNLLHMTLKSAVKAKAEPVNENSSHFIGGSEASEHSGDMYCNAHTYDAVRHAAGGAVQAALAIASGRVDNALCILRPPGHHAGPSNASGFCMFNNVAIAARALQREAKGMHRIVIFDWDVHHGDGTERIFYEDPSVLCISIHQYARGHPHRFHSSALRHKTAETYAMLAGEEEEAETPKQSKSFEKEAEKVVKNAEKAVKTEERAASAEAKPSKRSRRAHAEVDYEELDAKIRNEAAESEKSAAKSRLQAFLDAAVKIAAAKEDIAEEEESYDPEEYSLSESSTGADTEGYDTSSPNFYPGTGRAADVGAGRGTGYNVNIPLPCHRFGDMEYCVIMQTLVLPLIRGFGADCIIIAGGFDAVQDDTLGNMELTPSGYAMMTRMLMDAMPHGRVLCVQEGGYNVPQVALCIEAVARTLLGRAGAEGSRTLLHRSSVVVDEVWEALEATAKGAAGPEEKRGKAKKAV